MVELSTCCPVKQKGHSLAGAAQVKSERPLLVQDRGATVVQESYRSAILCFTGNRTRILLLGAELRSRQLLLEMLQLRKRAAHVMRAAQVKGRKRPRGRRGREATAAR